MLRTTTTNRKIALQVIDTTGNDGVSTAIIELVPAVHHANAQLGELVLDLVDPVQELIGTQAIAVKAFGTNGDRTNGLLVSRNRGLERIEVLVERLVVIRPRSHKSVSLVTGTR